MIKSTTYGLESTDAVRPMMRGMSVPEWRKIYRGRL